MWGWGEDSGDSAGGQASRVWLLNTLSSRHREKCQLEVRRSCSGSVACEGAYFLVRTSADPNFSTTSCVPTNALNCDHKIMRGQRGWRYLPLHGQLTSSNGAKCLRANDLLTHPKVP